MLGFLQKFFKVHRVWRTVSIAMRGGTSDFPKMVWWYKYFCMKITAKHRPSRSKLGRWTGDTFARKSIKPMTYIFGHKKMGGIAHQYVYVVIYNRNWCCFSVFGPHKHHFWYFRSVDDDGQYGPRSMFDGDFDTEILIPPDGFLCIRGPAAHWHWNRPSNMAYFEKLSEKSQHFDFFPFLMNHVAVSLIFRKI